MLPSKIRSFGQILRQHRMHGEGNPRMHCNNTVKRKRWTIHSIINTYFHLKVSIKSQIWFYPVFLCTMCC